MMLPAMSNMYLSYMEKIIILVLQEILLKVLKDKDLYSQQLLVNSACLVFTPLTLAIKIPRHLARFVIGWVGSDVRRAACSGVV